MMGRSHVLMGVCAVTVATGMHWIDWSIPNVAALTTGLVLGGVVLPDIDHSESTVTRSFGPVTGVLSDITRFVCRRVYRMSRLPSDPANRDPHRTFTHTWPGALLFGMAFAFACWAGLWVAVGTTTVLFGMFARALDRSWQPWVAATGGVLMWDLYPHLGEGVWELGIALAIGCWLHVLTDCVTISGAPMSWPKVTVKKEVIVNAAGEPVTRVVQRRRWHMTGPPAWIRFPTGGFAEKWIVRGSVILALVGAYWLLTV